MIWITIIFLLFTSPVYAQFLPALSDGQGTVEAHRLFQELAYEEITSDTVMFGWEEALSHTDTKGTRTYYFPHNANGQMMDYGPDSYAIGDFLPKVQGFFWHSCGRGGQAGCWTKTGSGGSEMDFDASYKDFMLRRGWDNGIIPVISLDMYHPHATLRNAGSTGTEKCMDLDNCSADTQCNDGSSSSPISSVLSGGSSNAWFNGELDEIAAYLLNLQGDGIPVIIRPTWEMTQEVDWWSCRCNTATEHKNYFDYIVEYLRDTKGVHNALYMFSPQPHYNDVDNCDGISNINYQDYEPSTENFDIYNCEVYLQFVDNATNDRVLDAVGTEGTKATLRFWLRDCYDRGVSLDKISTIFEGTWDFGSQGTCPSNCEGVNDEYWTELWNDIIADPKLKNLAFVVVWWSPHWGMSRVRDGGVERYGSPNPGALYNDAQDLRKYATMDTVNVIRRKPRIF